MNPLKKLAGETAVYGGSTILGRFLNWLLVPLYVRIFLPETFGIVINLMAYVAFLIVVLTYGMETGFFRFASDKKYSSLVYSTGMTSLVSTTVLFLLVVFSFGHKIADFLNVSGHVEYIYLLALTIGLDSLTAIPFARLRQQGRPVRFAFVKLVNIGVNIGLNLFFLLLCPWIHKNLSEIPIQLIWNPEIGIGYIFIALFVASLCSVILLIPELFHCKPVFDIRLLWKMLSYSFPILLVSIAGMININADKMLMPKLIPEEMNPLYQTGIYGANYKLAVVMTLFIQAFRFAFEPFFFSQAKKENAIQVYADVLKYFVIFGMLIFLGVMFYIDFVKILIQEKYYVGLGIVPYVLMGNFFLGIFFSISLWYKLTDKTRYGAYLALGGSAITLAMNFLLVPKIGYQGAAYAVVTCFFLMALCSYLLGQRIFPIPYDMKSIGVYFTLGMVLFALGQIINMENEYLKMALRTPVFIAFICYVIYKEKLWPFVRRYIPFAD